MRPLSFAAPLWDSEESDCPAEASGSDLPEAGWLSGMVLNAALRINTIGVTLSAMIAGTAVALGCFEGQAAAGKLPRQYAFEWTEAVPYVMGAGMVWAVILHWLGGGWYALRVRWSGGPRGASAEARKLYTLVRFLMAIPPLAYWGWKMSRYDSPVQAVEYSPWTLDVAIGLLVFVGVWVSYRCARSTFDLRPWLARWWLLVFPSGCLVLLIGLIATVEYQKQLDYAYAVRPSESASTAVPHDVDDAAAGILLETQPYYSMLRADDWQVMNLDGDLIDGFTLLARPEMRADVGLQVRVFRSEQSANTELVASASSLRELCDDWRPAKRGNVWGPYEGAGLSTDVQRDGERFQVRLLITELEPGLFAEFYEYNPVTERWRFEQDFKLMRNTWRLTPMMAPSTEIDQASRA